MAPAELVIEFRDRSGELAATVTLEERTMFWSEGRFIPGPAFGRHRELFHRVEAASRQFQAVQAGDRGLEALELAWRAINDRFDIRERDAEHALTDVGLHLDGARAALRW